MHLLQPVANAKVTVFGRKSTDEAQLFLEREP